MPRKVKKSSQPGKAKGRKAGPNADAGWPARALGRRQVLKGVVAGSGVVASAMSLPKEWSKPVVQSIVASAQAQVSPPQGVPAPLIPVAPVPVFVEPVPTSPIPVPMVPGFPSPVIAPVPVFVEPPLAPLAPIPL